MSENGANTTRKAEKKALDLKWDTAHKIIMAEKNIGYDAFATAIEGLPPEHINKTKRLSTLLDKSISKGAIRIATLLIEKGAEVNPTLDHTNRMKFPIPLLRAIEKGNVDMVTMLLSHGAKLSYDDRKSPLAMCDSIFKKNGVQIADLLVKAGADINASTGYDNLSPLEYSIRSSNKKVYDFLLSVGAKLSDKAIFNIYPSVNGIAICKDLLERGTNVNFTDPENGECILHKLLLKAHRWLFLEQNLKTENSYKILNGLLGLLQTARVNWHIKRISDGNEPLQAYIKYCINGLQEIDENMDKLITFCLEAGANIDASDNNGQTILHWAAKTNLTILKKFTASGANINSVDASGKTPLVIAVRNKFKDAVEFLCTQPGLDVNISDPKGFSALSGCPLNYLKLLLAVPGVDVNKVGLSGSAMHQALNGDVVQLLVVAGGDVNARDTKGRPPLYYAAFAGRESTIKALLANPSIDCNAKIDDGETVLDKAKAGHFKKFPEINEKIVEWMTDITIKWKGWTQPDLDKFDTIFTEEANEYSCCPVCLKYVGREDGCMYMRGHDCSSFRGDYYHKELYTKYKNEEGHIYWCTICGRVALGHRHYELATALGPRPELVPPKPEADPFSSDCKLTEGGGGRLEKLARFRRLREYALELQEAVGEKTYREAMNELVEETWNAPLVRKGILKKINVEKKWNVDAALFPAPPPPPPEQVIDFATFPDISQSTEDTIALAPTELSGIDAVTQEQEERVIQFHHVLPDGSVYNHENNHISPASLEHMVRMFVGAWKTPTFGFCWDNHGCKGRLWPSEIRSYVPPELYEDYKAKFNWRFRATTGGTRKRINKPHKKDFRKTCRGGGTKPTLNFFKEATNAECMLQSNRYRKTSKNGGF